MENVNKRFKIELIKVNECFLIFKRKCLFLFLKCPMNIENDFYFTQKCHTSYNWITRNDFYFQHPQVKERNKTVSIKIQFSQNRWCGRMNLNTIQITIHSKNKVFWLCVKCTMRTLMMVNGWFWFTVIAIEVLWMVWFFSELFGTVLFHSFWN